MAAGTLGPSALPAVAEILWLLPPPPPQPHPKLGGAGVVLGVDGRVSAGDLAFRSLPPVTKAGTWKGPGRLMRFRGPILQTGTGGREGRAGLSQDLTTDLGRLSFAQNHSWSFAALAGPFSCKLQNHGRGETWEVKLMRAGAEEIVEAQRH